MKKSKWTSTQSLIIISIIITLFTYIWVDYFIVKPKIEKNVEKIRENFLELSSFLDTKFPLLDSILIEQSAQLKKQNEELDKLKSSLVTE